MPKSSKMSGASKQLHLIQTQLSLSTFKQQFSRMVADGDSLLFLNDSLFVLLEQDFHSEAFTQLTSQVSVLAINEQLLARNIEKLIKSNIQTIDYEQFVKLSSDASKVVSW